jgi:hypothetical protein
MSFFSKDSFKGLLAEFPLTAELYWYLRHPDKPLDDSFSLEDLQQAIPRWCDQAAASTYKSPVSKKIWIFGTLSWWIEHIALIGLTLSGLGHEVELSYLPYTKFHQTRNKFNLNQDNIYIRKILQQAEPQLKITPLLNAEKGVRLPADLKRIVQEIALRDTQYSLQIEDVDLTSDLYALRLKRDEEAVRAAFRVLNARKPDVVLIPNGTIFEFGAVYQTARYLEIPTVTYEFGEQQQRIWLAKNAEVMRQDTSELWATRQDTELNDEQLDQVRTLLAARQHASLWENFSRRWQGIPSQGGEQLRETLQLDRRPIVLLATNVIGDSLTLGRQVFSDSMTEWLERTLHFFAGIPNVQLVIRIHPGELITKGPSVADVVQRTFTQIPEHIHLIPSNAQVNTYDIIEIADFGLIYTTTVGMEMAMSGVPVMVIGNTHFRNRGFTLDPQSWENYFEILENVLKAPKDYSLTQQQVNLAWNYAFRFFFEYPQPFPWHLLHRWEDEKEWPISRVLSDEGQELFGKTFQYLSGEPIPW